jgi:hypothetical protein
MRTGKVINDVMDAIFGRLELDEEGAIGAIVGNTAMEYCTVAVREQNAKRENKTPTSSVKCPIAVDGFKSFFSATSPYIFRTPSGWYPSPPPSYSYAGHHTAVCSVSVTSAFTFWTLWRTRRRRRTCGGSTGVCVRGEGDGCVGYSVTKSGMTVPRV